jgi:hypothetical protein
MSLSASIKITLSANLTRALDLLTAQGQLTKSYIASLTDGTGANQADRIFHDTRTLTASGTEDLDLNGVLTDIYGQACNFARIKGIVVLALAANTNNVNVTRPASNGFPLFLAASDGIPVRPGGAFAWVDPSATGIAVTAGTGDLLTLTNSAGSTSVTYDIIIIGASA